MSTHIGREYRCTVNGQTFTGQVAKVERGRTILDTRTGQEWPGIRFLLRWVEHGKRRQRWTPFYADKEAS